MLGSYEILISSLGKLVNALGGVWGLNLAQSCSERIFELSFTPSTI